MKIFLKHNIYVWVTDYTLCVQIKRIPGFVFMFRVCRDWKGRFSFHKVDIPWFVKTGRISKTDDSYWTFYTIPFFLFATAELIHPPPSP